MNTSPAVSPTEQQRQYTQSYNGASFPSGQGNELSVDQPTRWTSGSNWTSNGEATVQPGAYQQSFLGHNNTLMYADAPPSLDDQASEASSDTSHLDSASSSTGNVDTGMLSDSALATAPVNAIGSAASLSSYGQSTALLDAPHSDFEAGSLSAAKPKMSIELPGHINTTLRNPTVSGNWANRLLGQPQMLLQPFSNWQAPTYRQGNHVQSWAERFLASCTNDERGQNHTLQGPLLETPQSFNAGFCPPKLPQTAHHGYTSVKAELPDVHRGPTGLAVGDSRHVLTPSPASDASSISSYHTGLEPYRASQWSREPTRATAAPHLLFGSNPIACAGSLSQGPPLTQQFSLTSADSGACLGAQKRSRTSEDHAATRPSGGNQTSHKYKGPAKPTDGRRRPSHSPYKTMPTSKDFEYLQEIALPAEGDSPAVPYSTKTEQDTRFDPPAEEFDGPEETQPAAQEPKLGDGDLYTPRFVKGHRTDRHGWCDCGEWLGMKSSVYNYHMTTHGVSCRTGRPFAAPQQLRYCKELRHIDAQCAHCGQWINILRKMMRQRTWKNWFVHAAHCHHKAIRVRLDGPNVGHSANDGAPSWKRARYD